jgi:FMN-dependent oxidoreductase (nitrilotriacetate monooxygenase family)
MMAQNAHMKLGVFFHPTGHHVASWRHPEAQADAGVNFRHYVEIAQLAEAGRLDFVFLADNACVRVGHPEVIKRSAQYIAVFEPITLLSALAAVTDKIGLIATASTSYNEPYHVARKFASLDHISGGRAGWNVVTSAFAEESLNFGREAHYGHAERYERAREFAGVVQGLWDSWEDDAFVRNKESGLFFDPEKLHALNHKGKHFKVAGPLNTPRSPQGYPVMVQAGASNDGMDLGAQFAEVVFSNHFDINDAKAFYSALKGRLARYGRQPNDMKIMPGLSVIVGRTVEDAEEKYNTLQGLVHPIVARELLSMVLGGVDLSQVPFDGLLPDDIKPNDKSGTLSGFENWVALARRENLTIRELANRAVHSRGKGMVKGTPEQIVDQMQEWFEGGACDGFNIMPPYLPGGMKDFVELIVPELQRRGLLRREYEGTTLRDHLGLARRENRYVAPQAVSSVG